MKERAARMPAALLHPNSAVPLSNTITGPWKVFWQMKPLLAGLDAGIDWINLQATFRLHVEVKQNETAA